MMSRLLGIVQVNLFTQISVIIFLAIFIWILFWTYLPARRESNQRAAELPLKD